MLSTFPFFRPASTKARKFRPYFCTPPLRDPARSPGQRGNSTLLFLLLLLLFPPRFTSLASAQDVSGPSSDDAAVAQADADAARSPIRVGVGDRLESAEDRDTGREPLDFLNGGPENWTSPEGMSGSLQIMLLLTVLSLAPAVLLMTTCYVRIIIVLGLLRQAIGLQSLPPSQVMTSVALFMTLFVMTPVWTRVYEDAIVPYTDPEIEMSLEEAYETGSIPVREFMSRQIDVAGNHDDVHLFYSYMDADAPLPSTFSEVPMRVLLPAFILSELKTAFLMGFQIYLPFLIVDLVVASVTISMGMLMLPPAVISLPFKLLLFVLVDGWRLVVEMLMNSFYG